MLPVSVTLRNDWAVVTCGLLAWVSLQSFGLARGVAQCGPPSRGLMDLSSKGCSPREAAPATVVFLFALLVRSLLVLGTQ